MTQSIAAATPGAHPTCTIPWCRDHWDQRNDPTWGTGAIHKGTVHASAQMWTEHYTTVDGVRVPVMETVRVYTQSYTHPDPRHSEPAGVFVSSMGGSLSIEAVMDLAADLLRAAAELVAAEIHAARGGAPGGVR